MLSDSTAAWQILQRRPKLLTGLLTHSQFARRASQVQSTTKSHLSHTRRYRAARSTRHAGTSAKDSRERPRVLPSPSKCTSWTLAPIREATSRRLVSRSSDDGSWQMALPDVAHEKTRPGTATDMQRGNARARGRAGYEIDAGGAAFSRDARGPRSGEDRRPSFSPPTFAISPSASGPYRRPMASGALAPC